MQVQVTVLISGDAGRASWVLGAEAVKLRLLHKKTRNPKP